MPSVSKKQERFMAMCAHNPKHAHGKCPPMKTAKEFNRADEEQNEPKNDPDQGQEQREALR